MRGRRPGLWPNGTRVEQRLRLFSIYTRGTPASEAIFGAGAAATRHALTRGGRRGAGSGSDAGEGGVSGRLDSDERVQLWDQTRGALEVIFV